MVQIEGVPQPGAIVGFSLHKDSGRRALLKLVVRVFEKIARIRLLLEPFILQRRKLLQIHCDNPIDNTV